MSQLFANKGRITGPQTPLDKTVAGVTQSMNRSGTGNGLVRIEVSRAALSLEAIDGVQAQEVTRAIGELNTSLESVFAQHSQVIKGADGKDRTVALESFQRDAALAAAMMTGDVAGYLKSPVTRQAPAMEGLGEFMVPTGSQFHMERMRPALEAYDEKENRNVVAYSIAYNMQASRQDEFGEAFFPTVVVTPDQNGIAVSIRLISVMRELRRGVTGAPDNMGKRNILQAAIDATILKNEQTRVVPVYSDDSDDMFVASTLLPTRTLTIDTEAVTTSALAFGKKLSLIAISQTDALLETGILDHTDALDTAITLDALYMRLTDGASANEVIKFNTAKLPKANFVGAQQGNYRDMTLNFDSVDLKVTAATTKVDGAVSGLLSAGMGVNTARLGVSVSGRVNTETGELQLMASEITVERVTDASGNVLPLTTGAGATVKALFTNKATMVGYDVEANRTNSNRRQRGQLLDTTFYNQIWAVPLRSPITCARPMTTGDQNDSSDLSALITATRLRTSNDAVTALLAASTTLSEIVASNERIENTPAVLGVARFLVKPHYETQNLNLVTAVDSIKSHERIADTRATIVNLIRDMVYRAYRNSGYKIANDALHGGQAPMPTVIIGTDPYIAQYLMVEGDFRTVGNEFNLKVVVSYDSRMEGKIVMSFGAPGGAEGQPNPMNFGNMAWKPELTVVLPIHRNGSNSKELTVQPSYLHIVNLPVLMQINVSGIDSVVASKLTMNEHQIA